MQQKENLNLDTIAALCKKRGFVFPSSEIYGGFAATYDYGQLGSLLKKNIEKLWRYWNVTSRPDMEEIEGAIFMHPKTWEASGHVGGFADLMVEDLVNHKRHRADHLIEDSGILSEAGSLKPEEVDDLILKHNLKSPDGNPLSKAKRFNLMVSTHLGPVENSTSLVYLKGESCQNIYLDWKGVQETSRRKLPFGIAQIGKTFRNEITVKSFIFRTREFEQMDVQYFCRPEQADAFYQEWKQHRWDFYVKMLGLDQERLRWRQHADDERAFYARDAWDIEYNFHGLGFKEVEGLHDRGSYDLDQHSKFSGQDLSYFDEEKKERFNPFIVECSGGLSRMFLACLFNSYKEEVVEDETRIVLRLPYLLAPYKLAVLPLSKKKELTEPAQKIYEQLRKQGLVCTYDETTSIGKRYRRQDEIGTPYCVTFDFDSIQDNKVTIRDRDTMTQERVAIDDIHSYIKSKTNISFEI